MNACQLFMPQTAKRFLSIPKVFEKALLRMAIYLDSIRRLRLALPWLRTLRQVRMARDTTERMITIASLRTSVFLLRLEYAILDQALNGESKWRWFSHFANRTSFTMFSCCLRPEVVRICVCNASRWACTDRYSFCASSNRCSSVRTK